ncbi:MAG: hypothetical protein WB646_05910 [Steroidobacteraceae bacterium]
MSTYVLQKLIREINRNPDIRARFLQSPQSVVTGSDLSEEEASALLARDFGALYRLGVHGLLLRPFSILHGQSESDYLLAIRAGGSQ